MIAQSMHLPRGLSVRNADEIKDYEIVPMQFTGKIASSDEVVTMNGTVQVD